MATFVILSAQESLLSFFLISFLIFIKAAVIRTVINDLHLFFINLFDFGFGVDFEPLICFAFWPFVHLMQS